MAAQRLAYIVRPVALPYTKPYGVPKEISSEEPEPLDPGAWV
jgi:hypothetical protein